uniref:Tudor domain-containing protein n=1 Tax=Steinernema glaseri TaxID=37863 RepID=A0A1I7Y754_9BILA
MKRLGRCQFKEVADVLTGRWEAAARRCADKMHDIFVNIFFGSGEWRYCILDFRELDYGSTFEDILALDRRFVRCTSIDFETCSYAYQSCDTTCSKILNEMIPFFVLDSRVSILLKAFQ